MSSKIHLTVIVAYTVSFGKMYCIPMLMSKLHTMTINDNWHPHFKPLPGNIWIVINFAGVKRQLVSKPFVGIDHVRGNF